MLRSKLSSTGGVTSGGTETAWIPFIVSILPTPEVSTMAFSISRMNVLEVDVAKSVIAFK